MAERPTFYYDLASPFSWLAAERLGELFDEPPRWQPIFFAGLLKQTGRVPWPFTEEREARMREVERRARERGLLAVRWPDPWPANTLAAMRAATFAKESGRAAAFSLAAWRQAFNAGRDLADADTIVLAGAACELHPRALLKGIELGSTKQRLRSATEEALARGVRGIPSVVVGDAVFWGDDRLEEAAQAARSLG